MKSRLFLFALAALFPVLSARADLASGLLAYYDFEQSGATGLLNKAPGASAGDLSWTGTPVLSQTGFTGNASFTATDGTSDRGTLLAGNALNLVDLENVFLTAPYGSADLGGTFTISVWTYLARGSSNNSARFHVLESADSGVFDVSWGTTSTVNTTGYDDYVAFVESTGTATIGGLGAGAWQHALLAYDTTGANPAVAVYVNGSSTPVTATDTAGAFSFTALRIGDARAGRADDRHWDGMMDEIAIWNRALTPEERSEVFTKGSAGDPLVGASSFFVSVGSANPLEGTVSGGGAFAPGATASISATPQPGYIFTAWTGDFTGQPAAFDIAVNSDLSGSASFGPDLADTDGDGLTNYDEIVIYLTNPGDADTDGDEIPDGDELAITLTNPLTDDSALVDFVRANLCVDGAGSIVMTGPELTIHPVTGEVTLTLGFLGSGSGGPLAPLVPQSIVPLADGWEVTLPAPSAGTNSYRLTGGGD
jgi:hypothetical protein